MNDENKVSLFTVILNCATTVLFSLSIYIDLIRGYNITYVKIIGTIIWYISAICWIIKYIRYKKRDKK